MRDRSDLFATLARSKFRQRFKLSDQDRNYLAEKSLPVVMQHARDFVNRRLAPAAPANDGQQTPMRGHPVFVAQHATATCCRGCLAKWHGIRLGGPLSDLQVDYILDVLQQWIVTQKSHDFGC